MLRRRDKRDVNELKSPLSNQGAHNYCIKLLIRKLRLTSYYESIRREQLAELVTEMMRTGCLGIGVQVGRGAAEPRMMFSITSSCALLDLSCAIKNNLNETK